MPRRTPRWSVDADGFFALLDPAAYRGFVDEDWTLPQLVATFAREAARGALVVVHPGPDLADEPVGVRSAPSRAISVDQVVRVLEVTGDEGLQGATYADLTMAAQFADESPTGDGAGPRLALARGRYRVVLRRLRPHRRPGGRRPVLEVVVAPATEDDRLDPAPVGVPWLDL